MNRNILLVRGSGFVAAAALSLVVVASAVSQSVISGTSDDLDEYRSAYTTSTKALGAKGMENVAAVAIAGNDRVYTWYYPDGSTSVLKVIVGTTSDLDAYQGPRTVTLPDGQTPSTLVAVAIAKSNDRVYAWYSSRKVSSGTSTDLARYQDPVEFDLPGDRQARSIVGIGIARNDRVYAWYHDGTASQGWSRNLGSIRGPYDYSLNWLAERSDIKGIGIAGSNDHVYTFLNAPANYVPDPRYCWGHPRVSGRTGVATHKSTAKKRARRKWRDRVRLDMPGSPGQADWEKAQYRTYDCDRERGQWHCRAAAIPCAGGPATPLSRN